MLKTWVPKSSVRSFCKTFSVFLMSLVFSLASCVPMLHAVRAAMKSLRETGTDFSSAQGMGPREFFEAVGLRDVVELDSKAGGVAFASI
jgi:hypothetical protein